MHPDVAPSVFFRFRRGALIGVGDGPDDGRDDVVGSIVFSAWEPLNDAVWLPFWIVRWVVLGGWMLWISVMKSLLTI